MKPVEDVIKYIQDDVRGALKHYSLNPVEFFSDVLRMEAQDWQSEFVNRVAAMRAGRNDRRRIAVKSGTGVGKTSAVACLILWHLAVFKDSKIPCTAPTSPQIKSVLWPEIRKWVANIPEELREVFPFEVTIDMVRLYENFAVARTAQKEKPEAFQGFHSSNIMLIADEASGVPDEIFNAGDGVMSEDGAITILIGNPTRPFGVFYDAFHNDSHMYENITVSCLESSRVSASYGEEKKRKHGENSFEYQVRVLGEFFLEDDDIIIPRSWLEACVKRRGEIGVDSDYTVWGFDPSDGGRDAGALAKRCGNTLMEKVLVFSGLTSDQQVDAVVDEFYAARTKPDEIVVDAIGVGTNCFRQLRRQIGDYVKITPLYVGAPAKEDRYTSLRVELWGRGRAWVKHHMTVMEPDEQLIRELSSVVWEINPTNGKYRIPDKKVDGKSPNCADAFLLTFHSKRAERSSILTQIPKKNMMNNITSSKISASWG